MDLANDKFDKERYGLITGSPCSVLFPDKGNGEAGMKTYAKKLANNMYFRYYDEVSTWQMQHGNMNEHEAFTYYQTNYDFDIEKGMWKRVIDWGGTCDALAKDYGMDLKCPCSLEAWLNYIHDGIDKQQYHQAQMYMWLFDKPLWKVCAYLTETEWMVNRDLSYPVEPDKRMIIVEVPRDESWEDMLNEKSQFVIEKRDEFYEALCKQFGNKAQLETEPPLVFTGEIFVAEIPDHSDKIEYGKALKKKVNL